MTIEEEKVLDKEKREGIRDILNTIMYMRSELYQDIPPELKAEILGVIRLYGDVYYGKKG